MFVLNDEERAFADSVSRYLDDHYDFGQRAAILETGPYSEEHWRAFAELGWIASVFDEHSGGFGNAAAYVGILMEQFGRRLVVEPLLSTAIICGRLVASVGGREELVDRIIDGNVQFALAHEEQGALAATVKRGNDGLTLSGSKPVVTNGAAADFLLVTATFEGELILLFISAATEGVEIEPLRGHDGHNLANVVLNSVAISQSDVIATGEQAEDTVGLALDWGTAALCVEAVGSMSALLEATRNHLKTRVQYGRPLADFQVLQHRLADMFIQLETARSIAFGALDSLAQPPARRQHLVSAAKIYVFRAANFVGKQAVQLHGGMGVSEELDVAHHFKRLTMAALQLGHERQHLFRFMGSPMADGMAQLRPDKGT